MIPASCPKNTVRRNVIQRKWPFSDNGHFLKYLIAWLKKKKSNGWLRGARKKGILNIVSSFDSQNTCNYELETCSVQFTEKICDNIGILATKLTKE